MELHHQSPVRLDFLQTYYFWGDATNKIVPKEPNFASLILKNQAHTHTDTLSLSHTHTQCRNPLNEQPARRTGRYLHNTLQTQQTNMHDRSGIRIAIPRINRP
jgi:hypothetical protein